MFIKKMTTEEKQRRKAAKQQEKAARLEELRKNHVPLLKNVEAWFWLVVVIVSQIIITVNGYDDKGAAGTLQDTSTGLIASLRGFDGGLIIVTLVIWCLVDFIWRKITKEKNTGILVLAAVVVTAGIWMLDILKIGS